MMKEAYSVSAAAVINGKKIKGTLTLTAEGYSFNGAEQRIDWKEAFCDIGVTKSRSLFPKAEAFVAIYTSNHRSPEFIMEFSQIDEVNSWVTEMGDAARAQKREEDDRIFVEAREERERAAKEAQERRETERKVRNAAEIQRKRDEVEQRLIEAEEKKRREAEEREESEEEALKKKAEKAAEARQQRAEKRRRQAEEKAAAERAASEAASAPKAIPAEQASAVSAPKAIPAETAPAVAVKEVAPAANSTTGKNPEIRFSADQFRGIHSLEKAEIISVTGLFGMRIPAGYSYSMDPNVIGENYSLRIQSTDDMEMSMPYGFTQFTLNLMSSFEPYEIVEPDEGGAYVSERMNIEEIAYRTDNVTAGLVSANETATWKSYGFTVRIRDLNTQIYGVIQFGEEYDEAVDLALEVLGWIVDLRTLADFEVCDPFHDYNRLSFEGKNRCSVEKLSIPVPDGYALYDSKYIIPEDPAVRSYLNENGIISERCLCLSVPSSGTELKVESFDTEALCRVAAMLRENVQAFAGALICPLTVTKSIACLRVNRIFGHEGDMIVSQSTIAVLNREKVFFFILTGTYPMAEADCLSAIRTDMYRAEYSICSRISEEKI